MKEDMARFKSEVTVVEDNCEVVRTRTRQWEVRKTNLEQESARLNEMVGSLRKELEDADAKLEQEKALLEATEAEKGEWQMKLSFINLSKKGKKGGSGRASTDVTRPTSASVASVGARESVAE